MVMSLPLISILTRIGTSSSRMRPSSSIEAAASSVLVEQLVHAARREAAGRHLRFHIAERGIRKPDIVLDHAVEGVVESAFFVNLELVELEPFEPGVADRGTCAESGALPADVDPVRPHHAEHQEFALVEIG